MAVTRRRLSTSRTWGVEAQLRARSEQLKPGGELRLRAVEQVDRRATALGCCHVCSAIVYADDSLAMVGGHLLHSECAPAAAPEPPDRIA